MDRGPGCIPRGHPGPACHRPRSCVGFGFYAHRSYCPSYYAPYFYDYAYDYGYGYGYGYAPTWFVSPSVVQETVVVSPPVVYTTPQVVTTDAGAAAPVYTEAMGDAQVPQTGAAAPVAPDAAAAPTAPDANTAPTDGQQLYQFMLEGTKQFSQGAYEEAARMFLNVTLQDPANVDAALAYAVARFATGDYAVSAIAIRRGVGRLPDVVNAAFDLRERYGIAADFDRHLLTLQNYLQQRPDTADALLVLGFVQHFTAQRDAARQTFERLRQVSRPDAELAATFLNARPVASPPPAAAPPPVAVPEPPVTAPFAAPAPPQGLETAPSVQPSPAPDSDILSPIRSDSPASPVKDLTPYVVVVK